MICLECGKIFDSQKGLHLHAGRAHGGLANYYQKFYPKTDLYSGKPLVFKNLEDYQQRDFNTKENLCLWTQNNPQEVVEDYILNLFEKRAERKQTFVFPSHIELKGLFAPSWFGLISIFKNKERVVEEIGKKFTFKYNYLDIPKFSSQEPLIFIDTREQFPLPFENTKVMKLSCGDYTAGGDLFSDVFIERKSLSDLISTLSAGKERFLKELDRAKNLGYYIVVLIEDSFENLKKVNPSNSFNQKITGKYIVAVIRQITVLYPNVQFVFANDRKGSKRIATKIFQMKEKVKEFDLEFLKDFNMI